MKMTVLLMVISIGVGILSTGMADVVSTAIISLTAFGIFMAVFAAISGINWLMLRNNGKIKSSVEKTAKAVKEVSQAKAAPEIKPVASTPQPKPAFANQHQQRYDNGNRQHQQHFHRERQQQSQPQQTSPAPTPAPVIAPIQTPALVAEADTVQ